SGGVCSRVQGTHALNFRYDRERGITCFQEWIEAMGQTESGTNMCLKAVKTITVTESVVKLDLGKYKLESSKSEEKCVCEKDHKEDNDGNGNSDNDGNRKPRVGKKKPNRKRDKLK
ncbi:hypothetical protein Gotur_030637, partial [Gossypium turneri]